MRHAAAALGRAHMEHIGAADTNEFAVSEATTEVYTKAIKALRNYLGRQGNPDRAVVLMCSAVFFAFELVRGERSTALRHLRNGLEILNQWHQDQGLASDCGGSAEMRDELVAVFARLDLQASAFDDRRLPVLELHDDENETAPSTLGNARAPPFATSQQAQLCLFPLLHKTLRFLVQNQPLKFICSDCIREDILLRRRRLLDQFRDWEERISFIDLQLDANRSNGQTSSTSRSSHAQEQALPVCKLHSRTLKLLLLHSIQDHSTSPTPSFDDEADDLLELAREGLPATSFGGEETAAGSSHPSSERRFSLHLGIVAPIFLLALKTRRQGVRESAVDLLRSAKGRREGFYDADLMADMLVGLRGCVFSPDIAGSGESDDVAPKSAVPRMSALEWLADDFLILQHRRDEAERLQGLDGLLTVVC